MTLLRFWNNFAFSTEETLEDIIEKCRKDTSIGVSTVENKVLIHNTSRREYLVLHMPLIHDLRKDAKVKKIILVKKQEFPFDDIRVQTRRTGIESF